MPPVTVGTPPVGLGPCPPRTFPGHPGGVFPTRHRKPGEEQGEGTGAAPKSDVLGEFGGIWGFAADGTWGLPLLLLVVRGGVSFHPATPAGRAKRNSCPSPKCIERGVQPPKKPQTPLQVPPRIAVLLAGFVLRGFSSRKVAARSFSSAHGKKKKVVCGVFLCVFHFFFPFPGAVWGCHAPAGTQSCSWGICGVSGCVQPAPGFLLWYLCRDLCVFPLPK